MTAVLHATIAPCVYVAACGTRALPLYFAPSPARATCGACTTRQRGKATIASAPVKGPAQ